MLELLIYLIFLKIKILSIFYLLISPLRYFPFSLFHKLLKKNHICIAKLGQLKMLLSLFLLCASQKFIKFFSIFILIHNKKKSDGRKQMGKILLNIITLYVLSCIALTANFGYFESLKTYTGFLIIY